MAENERPKELRIALAMNGGVSLAIWIGGVNNELLRLANAGIEVSKRREAVDEETEERLRNPYFGICEGLNVVPIVDVITGASAGGLNGVFLALGIVYRRVDLRRLRDLWINAGSFESLLRDPTDARLPSLMKGDEYFFVKLREAAQSMMIGTPREYDGALPAQGGGPTLPPPVQVRLTTTSLAGSVTTIRDAADNKLYDTDHHAVFKFEEWNFAGDGDIAEKLARACRSTASFPGAFEPSLLDPRMFADQIEGVNTTQYVVDGGVLVNLPASVAIETIVAQPSRERVERVLALVVPDPAKAPAEADSGTPAEPNITNVITASVVGIPRVQSLHQFLVEIETHNHKVEARRAARSALLSALAPTSAVAAAGRATLGAAAVAMFPSYRANRTASEVADISAEIRSLINQKQTAAGFGVTSRVSALFRIDIPKHVENHAELFPFVPAAIDSAEKRCWGSTTVARVVPVLVGLVNDAREIAPSESDAELMGLKLRLSTVRRWADAVSPPTGSLATLAANSWWEAIEAAPVDAGVDQLTTTFDAALDTALADAVANWPSPLQSSAVDELNTCVAALGSIAFELAELLGSPEPTARVAPFAYLLNGCTELEALQALLNLEVVECAFAGSEARNEQHVTLAEITSRAPAPIDTANRKGADQKLAGVQLGHFGAFLKQSWRANDWLWGRLDAATRLVKLLHEHSESAATTEEIDEQIVSVQLDILREELGVLVCAIEADEKHGSPMTEDASAFVRAAHAAQTADALIFNPDTPYDPNRSDEQKRTDEETRSETLKALHALNHIGAERLPGEVHTDLAVRTSVKALATTTTVANRSGPKLLAGPTKTARSVSVLMWYLVRLTEGRRRAAAVLVGLVLGAAITAVATDLFVQDLGAVATLGWIAIAAVLVLAMLRNPYVAIPVLVVTVVPGLLSTLDKNPPSWWPDTINWPHLPGFVGAIAFVAGFVLLGSLRSIPWVDQQVAAARGEANELRTFEIRSWLRRHSWPGLVLVAVTAAIVLLKNLILGMDWGWCRALAGDGSSDLFTRNGVAALVVVVLTLIAVDGYAFGRPLGLWPTQIAEDEPVSTGVRASLWLVFLGGLAFATLALFLDGDARPRIPVLVVAVGLPVGGTVWLTVMHARSDSKAWLPMWSVAPATLVVVGFAIAAFGKGDRHQKWGELFGVLLGTALLEELVFRGGLMSLSLRTQNRWVRILIPGLAFGFWHLIDAIHDAHDKGWETPFKALYISGTVALMAIVSWLILEPLRLRGRSIVGPWLLHAAVNGSLIALGFSSPLAGPPPATACVGLFHISADTPHPERAPCRSWSDRVRCDQDDHKRSNAEPVPPEYREIERSEIHDHPPYRHDRRDECRE